MLLPQTTGQRAFFGPPAAGGFLDGTIWYVLVVPGNDDELTPFQGFSQGLTEVSSFLRALAWLPASVVEFGLSWPQRLEALQAGILSYRVIPVNVAHLGLLDVAEHSPFCVVFSSSATDVAVSAWIDSCAVKALHVTAAATGGDITDGGIDEESLSSFVRSRLEALAESYQFAVMARAMLQQVKQSPARSLLPFPSSSHNTCAPNELLLYRLGYEFSGDVRFHPGQGDTQVLETIVREASEILSLRTPKGTTPTLILATTGRSRLMEKRLLEQVQKAPKDSARTIAAAVRALRSQTGYFNTSEAEFLGYRNTSLRLCYEQVNFERLQMH